MYECKRSTLSRNHSFVHLYIVPSVIFAFSQRRIFPHLHNHARQARHAAVQPRARVIDQPRTAPDEGTSHVSFQSNSSTGVLSQYPALLEGEVALLGAPPAVAFPPVPSAVAFSPDGVGPSGSLPPAGGRRRGGVFDGVDCPPF